MRTSKYVYPSLDFKHLDHGPDRYHVAKNATVDIGRIRKLVKTLPAPRVAFRGTRTAERILSIFLSPNIIFGPRKYVSDYRNEWLERIEHFIHKRSPIRFSTLSFPFKIPMPLKTNRTLPDMGEVLALHRLAFIARLIKKLYKPGAIITVFTEGSFAPFAGVSHSYAQAYETQLRRMTKQFGYQDELQLIPVSKIETLPGFKGTYRSLLSRNRKGLFQKHSEIYRAYQETRRAMEKIVDTRMYDTDLLKDVFNPRIKNVSVQVLKARTDIQKRARETFVQYLSYIQTKSKLGALDRLIGPNLPLTVSPKERRLGVIPVEKHVNILPIHGVPMYSPHKRRFDIAYLTDLKGSRVKLKAIFLRGDKDQHPFYYEIIK
jgi:hypothetical protein